MVLRLFSSLRKDIEEVLKWSAENFGDAAAGRHRQLLGVAYTVRDGDPTVVRVLHDRMEITQQVEEGL